MCQTLCLGNAVFAVTPTMVANPGVGRKKRATDDVQTDERYVFEPGVPTNRTYSWPTPALGITEEQATQTCRDAITNTPAFDMCSKMFGDLLFVQVTGCVEDIKVRLSRMSVTFATSVLPCMDIQTTSTTSARPLFYVLADHRKRERLSCTPCNPHGRVVSEQNPCNGEN